MGKRLKASLGPHGNRNRIRGKIRNNSSTARFYMIRMLLSAEVLLRFSIGCIDIKGAYLQSGPITRTLDVRPEKWGFLGVHYGIFLKLPYGISEAGRK